jgi:hypothetical protein
MERAEVLRSIREDLLEYIQKRVTVEYDSHRQRPVSFLYDGRTHRINHVLDRFRMVETQAVNAFMVSTESGQVYCLVFQPGDVNQCRPVFWGSWVLSFRILEDGELMAFYRADRKMAALTAEGNQCLRQASLKLGPLEKEESHV